jgi:hypothetical protein
MRRKTIFISIFIGLILLIIFIVYQLKSIGYGMADNQTHYSNGIDESKTNGMFLGYYKPLQDSVVLGDLTLKTENIWYEKNWTTDHDFLFQNSVKVDSGIHFIAPYLSLLLSDLKVDLFLKVEYPGCHPCFDCIEEYEGLGFANTMSTKPDTLVLLFGTDNGFGHKDTITYIRE